MKINGQSIHVPFEKTIYIYRLPENIAIQAKAVPFLEDFERLCPEPKRMKVMVDGKFSHFDDAHPKYQAKVKEHNVQYLNYLVLRTLDIEWDTVDLEDPETWGNWKKEASASGFSNAECNRLANECVAVHNPTAEMVDQMRDDFLRTASQQVSPSLYRPSEETSISSGEPVSDSD